MCVCVWVWVYVRRESCVCVVLYGTSQKRGVHAGYMAAVHHCRPWNEARHVVNVVCLCWCGECECVTVCGSACVSTTLTPTTSMLSIK